MHYYQFNIGDYASHTSYLTLMEDLAYRRLLDRYYLTEKPICLDVKKCARLIGMANHVDSVRNVLDDFFNSTNDGFIHNRAEKELSQYQSKADVARVNGKKGGRPKKTQLKPSANPEITQSVILANPEITKSKTNHKPITNNHKPITINNIVFSSIDDFFDFIWSAYGRRGNKKTSLAKLKKLKTEHLEKISIHVPAYVQSTPDKTYRKHFETYLNQEHWENEINQSNIQHTKYERLSTDERFELAKTAAREFNSGTGDGPILEKNDEPLSIEMDGGGLLD